MADSTLALNPVTPLRDGAVLSTANPLLVSSVGSVSISTGGGWLYWNTATASGGGFPQLVKTSAGTVHGLTINTTTTGGTAQVIDAAATAATPLIAVCTLGAPTSFTWDANTTAGILLITTASSTATVPNLTLLYK